MSGDPLVPRDLERYLCGAVLNVPGRILPACQWLPASAFGDRHCRLFWQAVLDAYSKYEDIDAGLILIALEARKLSWEDCGSFSQVCSWMEEAPEPVDAERWAEEISRRARRRAAVRAMRATSVVLEDPGQPAETAILELQLMLQKLVAGDGRGNHDLAPVVDKALEEIRLGQKSRLHVPTGITPIDQSLGGGLEGGTPVTLAGQPGTGKTAFALQTALHAAGRGYGVLYATGEMTSEQLTDRALSHLAVVGHDVIRDRQLSRSQQESIERAGRRLRALPLRIHDNARMSVDDVAAYAAGVPNLGLIVVDFLQLLSLPEGSRLTGHEKVDYLFQGCVQLSKVLNVAMIIICQLKRQQEAFRRHGSERWPKAELTDLKGSTGLEYGSCVVMFLDQRDDADADPARVGLRIAKNRNGRVFPGLECEFKKDVQSILHKARFGTYPLASVKEEADGAGARCS